jgi:hypothetical protein
MRTTIRVAIDSSLHHKITQAVERGHQWSHEMAVWDIVGAKRIERTDFIRVELQNDVEDD